MGHWSNMGGAEKEMGGVQITIYIGSILGADSSWLTPIIPYLPRFENRTKTG